MLEFQMILQSGNSVFQIVYVNNDFLVFSSKPIDGFLDDYAFMIRGLLDLFTVCQDEQWLQWADGLQQMQDQLFWDQSGGYFTSAIGDANILVRSKEGSYVT